MLHDLLATMTRQAQTRGLSDREWATAGLRHETLCRVKRRGTCDAATLEALARGCGLELALRTPGPALDATESAADQLFPAHLSRDMEERLLTLCAHGDLDPAQWRG